MLKSQNGFTLVELSIVLVILGLLIGGVLTGQSLIRAAELRSVTTQYSRYVTAVQTFRDKYFALPGDMTNAQSYWGVAHATPATCVTTTSTTAVTCNGDGNGMIDLSTGSNEYYRAWQQLANAGLIEGSYDGVTHGSTAQAATTANSPAGRPAGSLWQLAYTQPVSSGSVAFNGDYGNAFLIGTIYPNYSAGSPLFKPEEAYNIDMKMDDGKPSTGLVAVFARTGLSNCTDASTSATLSASYLLNSTAVGCALYFRQQV